MRAMAASGSSAAEIARALGVSESTVRQYAGQQLNRSRASQGNSSTSSSSNNSVRDYVNSNKAERILDKWFSSFDIKEIKPETSSESGSRSNNSTHKINKPELPKNPPKVRSSEKTAKGAHDQKPKTQIVGKIQIVPGSSNTTKDYDKSVEEKKEEKRKIVGKIQLAPGK